MTVNVTDKTNEYDNSNTTEYILGSTTYTVTLNFNNAGETLAELLGRLIEKSLEKSISCQAAAAKV